MPATLTKTTTKPAFIVTAAIHAATVQSNGERILAAQATGWDYHQEMAQALMFSFHQALADEHDQMPNGPALAVARSSRLAIQAHMQALLAAGMRATVPQIPAGI